MKPSWKGLKALKLLQKTMRPRTDQPEELVYMDGVLIDDNPVFYYLMDGELMIGLSHEEETVGLTYFKIDEEAKDGT